jgi:hypothetical protein
MLFYIHFTDITFICMVKEKKFHEVIPDAVPLLFESGIWSKQYLKTGLVLPNNPPSYLSKKGQQVNNVQRSNVCAENQTKPINTVCKQMPCYWTWNHMV